MNRTKYLRVKAMWFVMYALWFFGVITPSAWAALSDKDLTQWTDLVIPLPKEVVIQGSVPIAAQAIRVVSHVADSPVIQTTSKLLASFAKSDGREVKATIHLWLADAKDSAVPSALRSRLAALPNKEQAYAIITERSWFSRKTEITLVANTPVGLLYAARTLSQLVKAPAALPVNAGVEVPFVNIVDWPDIEDRGAWGCEVETNLDWMAQWKLNMAVFVTLLGIDTNNGQPNLVRYVPFKRESADNPRDAYTKGILAPASALGIKAIPLVVHFEQQPLYYLGYNGFDQVPRQAHLKHLLPMLHVSKSGEIQEGICFSAPVATDMLTGWLNELALLVDKPYAQTGYRPEIECWLSENASSCSCAQCRDKLSFELEIKALLKAWQQVKGRYPAVRLRVLLTQGSRRYNDKILAMLPPDIGVMYYDGETGGTYDTDRKPMIYPLLTEYAAKGGWLGVVPQISASYGQVGAPMSSPQFIQFRAREFVDKKLACMDAYAYPDIQDHAFNFVAEAEWTWNAHGRTPEEFARAYATITGICDPALFVQWALKAGNAGWDLAESRMFFNFSKKDPALGFYGAQPFERMFKDTRLVKPEIMRQDLADAREALRLAKEAKVFEMINESEYTLAGVESFDAMNHISRIVRGDTIAAADKQELAAQLDRLDRMLHLIYVSRSEWFVSKGLIHDNRRFNFTAWTLLNASDAARQVAGLLGIPDPRPDSRLNDISAWSTADFDAAGHGRLSCDVTGWIAREGGRYQLNAIRLSGAPIQIKRLDLVRLGPSAGKRQVMPESVRLKGDGLGNVDIYHPQTVREVSPSDAQTRFVVELEMTANNISNSMPASACSGVVTLRRVYERDEFDTAHAVTPPARQTVASSTNQPLTRFSPPTNAGQPVRVGVAKGTGDEMIRAVLAKQPDMRVAALVEVTASTLANCDVAIIPQTTDRDRLLRLTPVIQEWVKAGGGVLFTHDAVGYRGLPAMFQSIGGGADICKTDRLKIVAEHPVTKGLADGHSFNPGFRYDHIDLLAGNAGVTLVADEAGRPVIVVGIIGAGRVVLNGMLPGYAAAADSPGGAGKPQEPSGEELAILLNSVRWLAKRSGGTSNVTPSAAISGDNLVVNSSVEAIVPGKLDRSKSHNGLLADDFVPAGWSVYCGGGYGTWGVTEREAHSGKYSVFLRIDKFGIYEGEKLATMWLKQRIAAFPDTRYSFSFWLKGSIPLLNGVDVMLDPYWSAPTAASFVVFEDGRWLNRKVIMPTADWKRYYGTFKTQANTTNFSFTVGVSTPALLMPGHTIYLDDLEIRRES